MAGSENRMARCSGFTMQHNAIIGLVSAACKDKAVKAGELSRFSLPAAMNSASHRALSPPC